MAFSVREEAPPIPSREKRTQRRCVVGEGTSNVDRALGTQALRQVNTRLSHRSLLPSRPSRRGKRRSSLTCRYRSGSGALPYLLAPRAIAREPRKERRHLPESSWPPADPALSCPHGSRLGRQFAPAAAALLGLEKFFDLHEQGNLLVGYQVWERIKAPANKSLSQILNFPLQRGAGCWESVC